MPYETVLPGLRTVPIEGCEVDIGTWAKRHDTLNKRLTTKPGKLTHCSSLQVSVIQALR